MLKPQTKPNHAITILFPPTSTQKKDTTPKSEYGLANHLHKKTHIIQKK